MKAGTIIDILRKEFAATDDVFVVGKRLVIGGKKYLATIDLEDGSVERESIEYEPDGVGLALNNSNWVDT